MGLVVGVGEERGLGARRVTRLKNARSDFKGGQGSWWAWPIPRGGLVDMATRRVRGWVRVERIEGGRRAGGGISVIVVLRWEGAVGRERLIWRGFATGGISSGWEVGDI